MSNFKKLLEVNLDEGTTNTDDRNKMDKNSKALLTGLKSAGLKSGSISGSGAVMIRVASGVELMIRADHTWELVS